LRISEDAQRNEDHVNDSADDHRERAQKRPPFRGAPPWFVFVAVAGVLLLGLALLALIGSFA